jgi:hypothetical protein
MLVVYLNCKPHPTHSLTVDDFGDLLCIGTKEAIDTLPSTRCNDFQVLRQTWDHALREIGE